MNSLPFPGFGNWPTPISSALTAGASLQLFEPMPFGAEHWWLERDPEQGGRVDIVRFAQGLTVRRLPPQLSCRSRTHEYGGGSYCVTSDGVYFVNDQDQDIYCLSHEGQLRRITTSELRRYADLIFDTSRNRLICVQEQHYDNKPPENSVIALDLDTGQHSVLAQGYDFYASARPSPDGKQLAWLCWNHPCMPWDGAELWLADFDCHGTLHLPEQIAGSNTVSVFQPEWSAANQLHYIDDSTGWWNLYRYCGGKTLALYPGNMEFGLPQWIFAQSSYCILDQQRILCSYFKAGNNSLGMLDCEHGTLTELETDYNSFSYLRAGVEYASFIAASDTSPAQLIKLDLATGKTQSLRNSAVIDVDAAYFSRPQTIEFNTRHGDTAHAIYYPPNNPGITAFDDQRPPLIVITHGGPTAHNDAALDLRKQFWTSRGYALLDVNYSGSTGYGRAYRDRLLGQWGLRDAEDCCDAAMHMVKAGLVDAERLIIKGSSAGGYTVLCALTFHDVFSAGASYYGICELEALARHTHKFEAHYLDRLIGPYPEMREIYRQRSPIRYVDQLHCPVIFFQGLDDKVVPSEQAEMMFTALKQKGVATSYLSFPGEGHGFRKAETIIACLRAELEFYARVLDLPLAAECEGRLQIENYHSN
jgi:dipeptidyl aminopeptidase/acylaminoacyl peptidase